MSTTAATITDTLNAYKGDNIWQDIILDLPGYDEAATDSLDEGGNDRFIADGVEYRWIEQNDRTWEARNA